MLVGSSSNLKLVAITASTREVIETKTILNDLLIEMR